MMTQWSLNDKVPLDCVVYYRLTIIMNLFFFVALCKHGKTSIVSALSVRFGVRSVCFSLKCSFSLDCDIEIFFYEGPIHLLVKFSSLYICHTL